MILTPPVWRPPRAPWRCHAARIPQLLIAFATVSVSGCTNAARPPFVFFGAFFPDWMLLAGIGILAAIGTRIALVATGLGEAVPQQLLVCVSAGLTVAILIWLLWFGA